MATSLYQSVPSVLATLFGSIDGNVKAGAPVFVGSAGSIAKRRNQNGVEFYVRRFYGGDGTQQESYIGLVGEADAQVDALRVQIEEVKSLLPDLRLLVREGFQAADAKTYATLASLSQHGLFNAGAALIGSHAFGVILNQMGIRAVSYATEDVDIARREALAFQRLPEKNFLDMLRDSGIHFIEVPSLDRKEPATSFKQRGASRFHVDLLVPSPDSELHIIKVPELKAHATALPYLAYLLGQTQMSTLIGREGCCPIRVPVPERFAIHKLVVSQLRTNRDAKTEKDIYQAAVLLAALGERYPGAIESAVNDLPVSARQYLVRASSYALAQLHAHPRAEVEFSEAVAAVAKGATKTERVEIRCEEGSVGFLASLGAVDVGPYDATRGSVTATVPPEVMAALAEYPADFAVVSKTLPAIETPSRDGAHSPSEPQP